MTEMTPPKSPRDPNQLAKSIIDIATGQKPSPVDNRDPAAAIALHTMYYNFVRIHQTLRVSPAMAAGVSDKLWEVEDIVVMLEQWELANFKPEYQFIVRQYMIGKGHSVSVMWRGGEVDTIFGFEKEADALSVR
jgi:hypothetical protein